jgi:hypothetical protein
MRKRELVGWALAAVLTTAAFPALAQQDDVPILRPKNQTTKPINATLLVTCDLACNWKLDSVAKGRIDAGGSANAKVERGQHVLVATTEDSLDKVENEIEIKTPDQIIVHISLQPVRNTRLKAEQQARDKADQEVRDKAAREQQERERAAREAAAEKWTDPATGLMWTKKDNGSAVNWQQGANYCRSLRLAGYSDWRLPTIGELQGIYDADDAGWHVKGNLQLSYYWQWSSSQGNASGEAWTFHFSAGLRTSNILDNSYGAIRALCVRRSGK